jgi:aryl-alcohol dehydrogenase-like predicted oxidoreductase
LCGKPIDIDKLDAKDIRRGMPRFHADNFARNQQLLPPYLALAQELGCSPSQLAIAWLLHKAPHIVPIPGTTSIPHLHDDLGALNVKLSPAHMQQLEAMIGQHNVVGNRYNDQANSEVDTEVFA